MVPLGFMIDCRLASWPTRRSPLSVNATTDGVVRAPSALGMTIGSPPCQAAITELVVPRSIPTAVAIAFPLVCAATQQRPCAVSLVDIGATQGENAYVTRADNACRHSCRSS